MVKQERVPQILMGASSSNKLGCCKKISLEMRQSWRISDSDSCTCFPGRPRTSRSRLIMPSKSDWSMTFLFSSPPPKVNDTLSLSLSLSLTHTHTLSLSIRCSEDEEDDAKPQNPYTKMSSGSEQITSHRSHDASLAETQVRRRRRRDAGSGSRFGGRAGSFEDEGGGFYTFLSRKKREGFVSLFCF